MALLPWANDVVWCAHRPGVTLGYTVNVNRWKYNHYSICQPRTPGKPFKVWLHRSLIKPSVSFRASRSCSILPSTSKMFDQLIVFRVMKPKLMVWAASTQSAAMWWAGLGRHFSAHTAVSIRRCHSQGVTESLFWAGWQHSHTTQEILRMKISLWRAGVQLGWSWVGVDYRYKILFIGLFSPPECK